MNRNCRIRELFYSSFSKGDMLCSVFLIITFLDMISPSYIFICLQIGPFQSSKGDRAKLKVKVRLNLHGIVAVDSATVREF